MPPPLKHFYLSNIGVSQKYTSKRKNIDNVVLPTRASRTSHGDHLIAGMRNALQLGDLRNNSLPPELKGYHVSFKIGASQQKHLDSFQDPKKRITLASVKEIPDTNEVIVTSFLDATAKNFFIDKFEKFKTAPLTRHGKPPYNNLACVIDDVLPPSLANLITENVAVDFTLSYWWEVWLDPSTVRELAFRRELQAHGLSHEEHPLQFVDRKVYLVQASLSALEVIQNSTLAIRELRFAKDNPAPFLIEHDPYGAVAWSNNFVNRLQPPSLGAPRVCLLDSGVKRAHPLIQPLLPVNGWQAKEPTWDADDSSIKWGGHGTSMAGLCLYGDMVFPLQQMGPHNATHLLESVKILPDTGYNSPKLYGLITETAVAKAELAVPNVPRTFCMAITNHLVNSGLPSTWSSAIDKLSFSDSENPQRLFVISAGNIPVSELQVGQCPEINDGKSIEDPAQAFNSLTVGAFTEKTYLSSPTYDGWTILAPAGELCPTSRTSLQWPSKTPIKPDVVFEGGNFAADQTGFISSEPEIQLLTTNKDYNTNPFTTMGATSAATALASKMASEIIAHKSNLWPETVRALIVHSAQWTPAMKDAEDSTVRLKRYGYGVPNLTRAINSFNHKATFVIQQEFIPFVSKNGKFENQSMVLHELPWPAGVLQNNPDLDVNLKVTLSYFIEPKPGHRGSITYYPSHCLRFSVRKSGESTASFLKRINKAAAATPTQTTTSAPLDGGSWDLDEHTRNRGSIHSDTWRGKASALATKGTLAIYPTSGWWRQAPSLGRLDTSVRYALIITLEIPESANVNIYNEIQTQINAAAIPLMV